MLFRSSDCKWRQECRVQTQGIERDCLARTALSKNIRRKRRAHGLTQQELAERAGIDRSYLARLEAEAINVSINVVFALSKALNCNPPELFEAPDDG